MIRSETSIFRWPAGGEKNGLLVAVLLVLFVGYDAMVLKASFSEGWPDGFGDSFALWSWGRIAGERTAAYVYDLALLHSSQIALGMDPADFYPFIYPPSYLLVLWPLGRLPGWAACTALLVISLLLYLWATVGRNWRSLALVFALTAPTTTITIACGQGSFLAAAMLVGGLRVTSCNPIIGGILLGLLSYKPQFGLLLPVALVSARLWRTLAAAAVTTVSLFILTAVLFGGAIWFVWISSLLSFSGHFAESSGPILHWMPTIFAALLQLGITPVTAQVVQWAATVAVATIVWALFRSGPQQLACAALLVGALLATPYAFVYDLPILTTAVIWVVDERQRSRDGFGTGEVFLLVLAMLAPMTLSAVNPRYPLPVLSLILLLGVILRRAWQLRAISTRAAWVVPAGSGTAEPP
jgi:hypothetical protein